MSSYTEDARRLMVSDSGADVFVNKHVIMSALLPAIRDLIRRERPTTADHGRINLCPWMTGDDGPYV